MLNRSKCVLALVSVAGATRTAGQFHTMTTMSITDAAVASSSSSPSEEQMMQFQSQQQSTLSSPSSSSSSASSSNQQQQQQQDDTSPQNDAALVAGSALMRFKISRPEQFYFPSLPSSSSSSSTDSSSSSSPSSSSSASSSSSICRLCNEFVVEQQRRFHLVGAGPRGPSTHMGREIMLDSLLHYAKLGYDPALVMRSWPHTLMSAKQYARIPHLLPQKSDPCDLTARATRVSQLLHSLAGIGVLNISISPHSEATRTEAQARKAIKRRFAFERFECVGDNAWGSNISGRMMVLFGPDKRWGHCNMHHSFNTFRDLCEMNTNLERVFELLHITSLLPPVTRAIVGDGKIKADILEAIIGELDSFLYAHDSNLQQSEEYVEVNDEHFAHVCAVIRHVLNEIFDLTLLFLVYLLAENAVPIARELALHFLILGGVASTPTTSTSVSGISCQRPPLDAGDSIRTRRSKYHANFVPSFSLPSQLSLHQKVTPVPVFNNNHSNNNNNNNNNNKIKAEGGVVALNGRPKASFHPQLERFVATFSLSSSSSSSTSAASSESSSSICSMFSSHRRPSPPKREEFDETTKILLSDIFPQLQKEAAESSSSLRERKRSNNKKKKMLMQQQRQQQHQKLQKGAGGEVFCVEESSSLLLVGSTLEDENHKFRKFCPFRRLSKFPPHSYNPYGLDDDEWIKRWSSSSSSEQKEGEGEEEVREIFHEDVADSVNVVLAQFEASAHMRKDKRQNQQQQEEQSEQDKEEQEFEKKRRFGSNMTLYERLAIQNTERFLLSSFSSSSDDYYYPSNNNDNDLLLLPRNVPQIYDEILERTHPIKNGITVGSEGASFSSISTVVSNISAAAAAAAASSSSSTSTFGNNNEQQNQQQQQQQEQKEQSMDSSSSSTTTTTTASGDIDLEEIKRRNLAKRKAAGLK